MKNFTEAALHDLLEAAYKAGAKDGRSGVWYDGQMGGGIPDSEIKLPQKTFEELMSKCNYV